MLNSYLKQNINFFRFLLGESSTREQKKLILINISKTQLLSIIEIIYNLLKNDYIKKSSALKQVIKKYNVMLIRFISLSRTLQLKFIRKHFKIIYLILSKAKDIIFLALSK